MSVANADDFGYGSNPGSTTIKITQTNILHTDPALSGGDQRIPVDAGTLTFAPPGGDATNAPSFDPVTGTLIATGSLHSPTFGTADPIDYASGYAPHAYSPMTIVNFLSFTPASSLRLNGNEWLETDFTATVTDGITGSTQVVTKATTFANPVHIAATSTSFAPQVYGTPVSPFSGAFTLTVPLTGIAVANISQTSFIHTDPGAADDQRIAMGPGTFTGNTALGYLSATPAGLTTVTANHPTDLNSMLNRLAFTPAQVTLTGHQTLETDFTVYVSDGYGDFDTFNRALIEMAPAAPASNTPSTPVTTAPTTTTTAPAASVYRFFDSNNGTHFFTSSTDERNTLLATRPDLVEESNGFGAVDASAPNAVAVYRFFDTVHGTQFITSNASERDTVQATRPDLTFEASDLFYEHGAKLAGDVAVYRFFDTKLGTHFYTGNQSEHDSIATPGGNGYRADLISEGVAFYAPTGLFK